MIRCCSDLGFVGMLSDVTVWGRELTHLEVKELVTHYPKKSSEKIVGYWPLDDGVGEVLSPWSAAQRHACVVLRAQGLPMSC